jgi:GDPmannose 4,6-dehydratase
LLEGDLRDLSSLLGVLETAQPDEIYNLGAISFVGLPFKQPELAGDITGMGVLRMLEAVRIPRRDNGRRPVLPDVELGDELQW